MSRVALFPVILLLLAGCPGARTHGLPDPDASAATDSQADQGDAGLTLPGDTGGSKLPDGTKKYLESSTCGSANCSGCCLANGTCVSGNSDTQCGKLGIICVNCGSSKAVCQLGTCCAPKCSGKTCGVADGCGGTCKTGSGCCTPKCQGKKCDVSDGCGGKCKPGSGCCTPACASKTCGASDGCGATCKAGSGCCTPSCSGKKCGSSDGCGGTCKSGSGCCTPNCNGAQCGGSDGCGGTCSGSCSLWEYCSSSKKCVCGPSPHYKKTSYGCRPSCGTFLGKKGLPNKGGGCCSKGCKSGTLGGGIGATYDCTYCCSSTVTGVSSCK